MIGGECSVGELISFYTLIVFVTGPASRIIGVHQTLQDANIAMDRLFDVMDVETEDNEERGTLSLRDIEFPSIDFYDVSFRYGSRKLVLEHATFTIPTGRLTAIVGESGSGKSTIVKVLQGLYPLTSGDIRFGNVSIKDVDVKELRSFSSAVPQEIELFHGTIAQNIACGEISPDLQKVMNACMLSGADTFIANLPTALHTMLGEHGMNLSGGERQRLALARALYRNPGLLLLDEATSALDSETESVILAVLQKLCSRGITVVAVAHRLSTIMHADKILVLDGGRIAEEGTHTSLLHDGSIYHKLWIRQTSFIPQLAD